MTAFDGFLRSLLAFRNCRGLEPGVPTPGSLVTGWRSYLSLRTRMPCAHRASQALLQPRRREVLRLYSLLQKRGHPGEFVGHALGQSPLHGHARPA